MGGSGEELFFRAEWMDQEPFRKFVKEVMAQRRKWFWIAGKQTRRLKERMNHE